MKFELKGGTSLSKGYSIIDRFSEDIDIRIEPPVNMDVKTGKNHDKRAHVESRKEYYEWLVENIKIDGIAEVVRDASFDDERLYRSGGIRLHYSTVSQTPADLKEGILLEVGFDNVTPNEPKDISSWAYDFATSKNVEIIDNRAKKVLCYHPGYTLVEKMQTISTKYRNQQKDNSFQPNFLRHYYDIYSLLKVPDVQTFIGTKDYIKHKNKRFRKDDNTIVAENEAFMLSDPQIRELYEQQYYKTTSLYYANQPAFADILVRIHQWVDRL